MELPEISVVIVSHNEELNIADCLESVTALDYPDASLEIIVVDSSTDRTKEIVSSFSRVKLIPSQDKSFSKKRNLGYLAAAYELVAFIDADCIAPADWLRRMVPHLRPPEVAAVGGNAYPPPNAPFLGKCIACLGKPAGGAIGLDSEVLFLGQGINYLATCCSLFKKRVLHEVGGFDEGLIYGNEDVNLCVRLLNVGYVIEYAPDGFVYHKTRNTFRQFIPWAFRRGKSHFHATKPALKQILFEPFSVIWLFIVLIAFVSTPSRYVGPLVLLALLLMLFFFIGLYLGYLKRLFPSGCRKLRLLVERRHKIGFNAGIIFCIIIPLFYLDRMIINLALLYSKVKSLGLLEKSAT